MMLVEKYANHQPVNRQSEQYAREGIELSVSTINHHSSANQWTAWLWQFSDDVPFPFLNLPTH
jgi:hypothetical protein